jgi:hypothetical protein
MGYGAFYPQTQMVNFSYSEHVVTRQNDTLDICILLSILSKGFKLFFDCWLKMVFENPTVNSMQTIEGECTVGVQVTNFPEDILVA